MLATLEVPMPATPPGDATVARPVPWRCPRCGHFLGTVRAGVLFEGANRSALPVVRVCPTCARRNIRLA